MGVVAPVTPSGWWCSVAPVVPSTTGVSICDMMESLMGHCAVAVADISSPAKSRKERGERAIVARKIAKKIYLHNDLECKSKDYLTSMQSPKQGNFGKPTRRNEMGNTHFRA